jgi:hypothetical protein
MTWGDLAQILGAAASLVAAIGTFVNGRKIDVVHRATNSMKDELVREVRVSSHAEGLREGREETK